MWCTASTRRVAAVEVEERTPVDRTRPADDAARDEAAEELSAAFVDGLLDVDALETRLEQVYAARTVGDVESVVAALPSWWRVERAREEARARRAARRRAAHRSSVRAYVAVMALLVAVWALTASSGEDAHPWFVWPMLGWGIPLLLGRPRVRQGRGRARG